MKHPPQQWTVLASYLDEAEAHPFVRQAHSILGSDIPEYFGYPTVNLFGADYFRTEAEARAFAESFAGYAKDFGLEATVLVASTSFLVEFVAFHASTVGYVHRQSEDFGRAVALREMATEASN